MRSMEITEQERNWALAIKKALMKEDEELAKRVTDFEYAHHAIIAKEKVPKAILRIKRLDTFRQTHGISTSGESTATTSITPEDALQIIQKNEQYSPGMFVSFGKHHHDDGDGDDDYYYYVSSWDYGKFLPSSYEQPEDWKNLMAASYYLFDAMQPDLRAIRAGVVMLCDTADLGWRNFSWDIEKYASHLHRDAYPIRIRNMTMLHAPLVFVAIYALCKPFLSKKVVESIVVNGNLHDDVQNKYPPSILAITQGGTQTTENMQEELLQGLKQRYSNMASFQLGESIVESVVDDDQIKEEEGATAGEAEAAVCSVMNEGAEDGEVACSTMETQATEGTLGSEVD